MMKGSPNPYLKGSNTMADIYVPSSLQTAFADISAFVADANAINGATKTALNTGLSNISLLFGSYTSSTGVVVAPAHPDFAKVSPAVRQKIQNEIAVLIAAVTAHA